VTDTQNIEHNDPSTSQPALTIQPLRASDRIDELAAALSKAQGAMKHPGKNKTAKVPMKAGGTYSYNYADLADVLDAVRAPFAANGLAVVQVPFNEGPNAVGICTRILHASGQWIEGTLHMPCADGKPQTIGSAITYGRRYALSPMAGIASDDDDDGSAAQGLTAQTERRARPGATNPAPAVGHSDRATKMLARFSEISIGQEDVEKHVGKSLAEFSDKDYASLKSFYDDQRQGTGGVKGKLTEAFKQNQ